MDGMFKSKYKYFTKNDVHAKENYLVFANYI